MESYSRRFIRAGLVWLGIGVLLGVAMAWSPTAHLVYRPAHMHANLLGFVSMMIFGVAYHVLPRFSARPLHAPRLASAHFWIANAGLAGMVGGFLLRPHVGWGEPFLHLGAGLSALGAFLFIYNGWRTTRPHPTPGSGCGVPLPVKKTDRPAPATATATAGTR